MRRPAFFQTEARSSTSFSITAAKRQCPVTIKLERTFGLAQGITAGLFTHTFFRFGYRLSDSLKTLLGPMQQGSAVVVVGTNEYLEEFFQTLQFPAFT